MSQTVKGVPVEELGEYAAKLLVKYELHTKELLEIQNQVKQLEVKFQALAGARDQLGALLEEMADDYLKAKNGSK